jgi:hypothetical protein
MSDPPIFDFLLLVEDGDPRRVACQHPPGPPPPELDCILALAIPRVVASGSLDSSIFSFNSSASWLFAWAFAHRASRASLVIGSAYFYPSVFIDFLRSFVRLLSADSDANGPRCRFGAMLTLLRSWQVRGGRWQIYHPFESLTVDVSRPEQLLWGFRYGALVPAAALVWQCLLTNAGVLIVAPTPDAASEAAIACLSLLPVPYRDPCLLFTDAADPRLARLRAFRLVATTDDALAQLPFGAIVSVAAGAPDAADHVGAQYRAASARHYAVLLAVMDFHLLSDPYADVLACPVPCDGFQLAPDLDAHVLSSIQATETFRQWRRTQIARPHTRTAFLSLRPRFAVARIAQCQLPLAAKLVESLIAQAGGDEHWRAVLLAHRRLLEKRARPGPSQ